MTTPNFANRGIGSDNVSRCWACNCQAPKQSNNHEHGWVSRWIRIKSVGKCREMYCGPCFRAWGWPEAPK